MTDCRVCLCDHDPAIHAATISIHRWFKQYVRMSLERPSMEDKKPRLASQEPIAKLGKQKSIAPENFVQHVPPRFYKRGSRGIGESTGV